MDRDILMQILKLVVMVATALITTYLIPWIRAHTNTEKIYAIMRWTREAVLAAEQIYGAQTGEEKKKYALDLLHDIVEAANINMTKAELEMLIEAAVGEMNKEGLSKQSE